MRYIALDTETTGLQENDRIIEIAAVEMPQGFSPTGQEDTGRQEIFHHYINPGPDTKVNPGAFKVHRISDEFLVDKPTFPEIAQSFIEFIRGAVLIIHNAPFDLRYMNFELALAYQQDSQQEDADAKPEYARVQDICAKVEDTLLIAQKKFPGQSNSLDALVSRFGIDASSRSKGHGALIDTKLLCKVYENLRLNQSNLGFEKSKTQSHAAAGNISELGVFRATKPTAAEIDAEQQILSKLQKGKADSVKPS